MWKSPILASLSFLELSHFFCSFCFIPGRLDHQEGFQDIIKALVFGKKSEAVLHGEVVLLGITSCFRHMETGIALAEGCSTIADGPVPCPFPGKCMGRVQCSWAQTFEAGVWLDCKGVDRPWAHRWSFTLPGTSPCPPTHDSSNMHKPYWSFLSQTGVPLNSCPPRESYVLKVEISSRPVSIQHRWLL